MEFTDRLTAVDRAVSAYRRFAHNNLSSCAPDMIVDLLHWHGRFTGYTPEPMTPEQCTDMLIEALAKYELEYIAEFEENSVLRGPSERSFDSVPVPGYDPPRRRQPRHEEPPNIQWDPSVAGPPWVYASTQEVLEARIRAENASEEEDISWHS